MKKSILYGAVFATTLVSYSGTPLLVATAATPPPPPSNNSDIKVPIPLPQNNYSDIKVPVPLPPPSQTIVHSDDGYTLTITKSLPDAEGNITTIEVRKDKNGRVVSTTTIVTNKFGQEISRHTD